MVTPTEVRFSWVLVSIPYLPESSDAQAVASIDGVLARTASATVPILILVSWGVAANGLIYVRE